MSSRRLLSASLANLLIPISGLVVSPFLSRALGPDGRGLYAALTVPVVVCGWLGTFGLQDALSFHLRTGRLAPRSAGRVALVASVPLGLAGVLLLAALGVLLFNGDGPDRDRFLLLALLAPLHILANLLIGALTGAADVRGVNLAKVLPALARTVLVVGACLALPVNAFWASLLTLGTVPAGIAVGLLRLRSAGAGVHGEPPAVEAVPVRSLVEYSLACLPGVLAAISNARLDQIIGLPVIGATQLGYYAVAVSVAEIPMVIAVAARTVLMGRPAGDDSRIATRPARLAILGSTVACGLLAASAPVTVPWFFGHAFGPAVGPTVVLCAATVLYACVSVTTAVLVAGGRAGWSSAALVTGSLAGIGLLFALAPLGATGAALAALGGYGVSAAMASRAIGTMPGMPSLRALTIPYRDDLIAVRDWTVGRVPDRLRRTDLDTAGVAALLTLAWLRMLVPALIQLLVVGRPTFNSRVDRMPAAGTVLGDLLSLAFIAVAGLLVVRGVLIRRQAGRSGVLGRLAAALGPLIALAVAGLRNGDPPRLVSLALPLAVAAICLRPPAQRVYSVAGVLCGLTAAVSVLFAAIRPDLGLLTGTAAGSKGSLLGGLLAGPYPHSNVLGLTLALGTPFVLAIGNPALRRSTLVVVLFAQWWTGARTSQVATAVVLLAYAGCLFLRQRRTLPGRPDLRGRWVAGWLLSAAFGTGIALVVLAPLLVHNPDSLTRRGRIWTVLLRQWRDRPVFGYGPDYFQRHPELGKLLGGQFDHGHNIGVHLLVTGGLLSVAAVAVLLGLAWRRSLANARAGVPIGALFLIVFAHVSWLEASHVPGTLAGYLTWLPLALGLTVGHESAERDASPLQPERTHDHG